MGGVLFWVGIAIYLIGVAWLVYLAWSNDHVGNAIGIFFLAPIFGLIYTIQNFDEAKVPYGLVILGIVLRVAGALIGQA